MKTEPSNQPMRRLLKSVALIASSWSCAITAVIALNPTQFQFCVAFVAITLAALLQLTTELTKDNDRLPPGGGTGTSSRPLINDQEERLLPNG